MISKLLKIRSERIIKTFTNTQKELAKINSSLDKLISGNASKMEKLNQQNAELPTLRTQHLNVISNISKILGNDIVVKDSVKIE